MANVGTEAGWDSQLENVGNWLVLNCWCKPFELLMQKFKQLLVNSISFRTPRWEYENKVSHHRTRLEAIFKRKIDYHEAKTIFSIFFSSYNQLWKVHDQGWESVNEKVTLYMKILVTMFWFTIFTYCTNRCKYSFLFKYSATN